ncbi:MAG: AAA family ATPase [Thermoplasmata archaeon]
MNNDGHTLMNDLYSSKFIPSNFSDFVGSEGIKQYLLEWAKIWMENEKPSPKAIMLIGPPGCGKTALALAFANTFNWPVILLDPSTARNKNIVNTILKRSGKYGMFTDRGEYETYKEGARKLILVDEADIWFEKGGSNIESEIDYNDMFYTIKKLFVDNNVNGEDFSKERNYFIDTVKDGKKNSLKKAIKNLIKKYSVPLSVDEIISKLSSNEGDSLYDKGGLSAIVDLIRYGDQPVILTLNDIYALRKKNQFFYAYKNKEYLKEFTLGRLSVNDITNILYKIKEKEKLKINASLINEIAKNADGDARAAINDLQASIGTQSISGLSKRDVEHNESDFIMSLFNDSNLNTIYKNYYSIGETPDRVIYWVDENIPYVLKGNALYRAYNNISKADIFIKRASSTRNYGLWKYANDLMIYTLYTQKNKGHLKYVSFPLILKKYKDYYEGNIEEMVLLAKNLHMSKVKFKVDMLSVLKWLYSNNEEFRKNFTAMAGLDLDMISMLLDLSIDNKKVIETYEEATKKDEVKVSHRSKKSNPQKGLEQFL